MPTDGAVTHPGSSLSPNATIVVCAHNEERYIGECLRGILAQTRTPAKIIIIADRCSDRTIEVSKTILPEAQLIEKQKPAWKNSYAENLEMGREKAIGDFLAIVDADILVPPRFLEDLAFSDAENASRSALVKTDPRGGWLNWLVSFWEKTYLFTPLGREPRGGARMISTSALDKVGGFRDVKAPDTDLDIRLRAASMKVSMDPRVVALHLREMTIGASISSQILAGEKRKELGISLSRTTAHSVVRLRPFVLYGYLKTERSSG